MPGLLGIHSIRLASRIISRAFKKSVTVLSEPLLSHFLFPPLLHLRSSFLISLALGCGCDVAWRGEMEHLHHPHRQRGAGP